MSKLVENICQGNYYGGALTMACPTDIDVEACKEYIKREFEFYNKLIARNAAEGDPIDMSRCRTPKTCGECPHYQGFSMTCGKDDKLKLLESKSTCKCTES